MTTALPAPATRRSPSPRLRLVGDHLPGPTATDATVALAGDRVGYLMYLPAHVDPLALLAAHGVHPEIHPLAPRRVAPPAPEPEPVVVPERVYADDGIRVDQVTRRIEVDGQELDLTYLEFGLLAHLVAHPHTVHTREALISDIWGYGHIGDGRTVDVHVARVRRKLGAAHRDRIITVRRVGYKYVPRRA
ncbi:winged helix-turn-helix domain-containing protein [Streptomyces sp. NPDC047821]|uniref:winged helix-turn-helix domain-containing protein n=1 Tax=Streptomyces sp. NPDC047821 TaxID=3365488 RepID=UPI0037168161